MTSLYAKQTTSSFLGFSKQPNRNYRIKKKKKWVRERDTLFVAGSEDNGGSLITDEALGDSSVAEVLWNRAALSQDSVGTDDLDDESVAGGAGLQLVDLLEFRLPQRWLRIALLLLRRWWCRRRHDDFSNPNPNSDSQPQFAK